MQKLDNHRQPPKAGTTSHFGANAGENGPVKATPEIGVISRDHSPPPHDFLSLDFPGDPKERRPPLLKKMLLLTLIILAVLLPITAALGLLTLGDGIGSLFVFLGLLLAFVAQVSGQDRAAWYLLILGGILALLARSWLNINGDVTQLAFNYFAVVSAVVLAGLIIHQIAPFVVTGVAVISFGLLFWRQSLNYPAQVALLAQVFFMTTTVHLLVAFMACLNARSILEALRRMAWQNDRLLQVNRRMEKTISLTTGVGNSIGQLAAELVTISQEQSERAHTQAQSVVIVTSTLEELSATARQVAEVADNVYLATEQALHTAETGGKAVGFGIDSVATLTDQIETISTIANELGRQSRRISEIVETITELAEETNLLALNATIEAAGAGEFGRRFAVVAQEVQFLATRSRAASRDVQNILGQIRTSINNTLKATNEGLNLAHRMSEVASQAGEALEQIIENVEGTTYLARQINLTTQQQRTATDQAVEMIRQVAGTSREATARTQQLLLASDRLNQTAASLRLDLSDPDPPKAET